MDIQPIPTIPTKCVGCCEEELCPWWDYMAWACSKITGAQRLVEESEVLAALARGMEPKKKAAPSVASAESGDKVEKVLTSSDSTSHDTREMEDTQA